MCYISEEKPFQFAADTAYTEVTSIVWGIEDEDWDVRYGLDRF